MGWYMTTTSLKRSDIKPCQLEAQLSPLLQNLSLVVNYYSADQYIFSYGIWRLGSSVLFMSSQCRYMKDKFLRWWHVAKFGNKVTDSDKYTICVSYLESCLSSWGENWRTQTKACPCATVHHKSY
jgi:hypothetical protein